MLIVNQAAEDEVEREKNPISVKSSHVCPRQAEEKQKKRRKGGSEYKKYVSDIDQIRAEHNG